MLTIPVMFAICFHNRIGFLGLGLMGSGVVSNLLKMGHVVTVWNRTAEKVQSKVFKYGCFVCYTKVSERIVFNFIFFSHLSSVICSSKKVPD